MISERALETGAWCRTASGLQFDLLSPAPENVRLGDVVHALSGLNRFTGHGLEFYSVAEHSVAVAKRVRELGGSPEQIRQALLHDAAEAYVGDCSSPMKRAMREVTERGVGSDYDEVERRVWADAVAPAFGLSPKLDPIVHEADKWMADIEGSALLPGWSRYVSDPKYTPRCWHRREARRAFAAALARAGVRP